MNKEKIKIMRQDVYICPKAEVLCLANPMSLLVRFSHVQDDDIEGYDELGEELG